MNRNSDRTKRAAPNRARGFTLIELMVSLGVFTAFMIAAGSFWSNLVRGGFQQQRRITDVNQTARLAIEYLTEDMNRAGSGQLFAPRIPDASPGYALIPLQVAKSGVYGQVGALPLTPSDGGPGAPDEITFVLSDQNRVGRLVWDDLASIMRVDFQPRDPSVDTVNPNWAIYPFFTGFFTSGVPSPFSPGYYDPNNNVWPGALLLIKTPDAGGASGRDRFGQVGTHRTHFRMVRVLGIRPLPPSPPVRVFQADIEYALEPENPFNRWMQALQTVAGETLYFDSALGSDQFYQQRIADNVGSLEAGPAGAMLGCAPRQADTDGLHSCSTVMMVNMRTYYVAQPGDPANPILNPQRPPQPALAMLTYEVDASSGSVAPSWDLAKDTILLTEGVEDLQFEYFFNERLSKPGLQRINIFGVDPQFNERGNDDIIALGMWNKQDRVPLAHDLTNVRVSLRATMPVGEPFFSDPSIPLANRTNYPSDPNWRRLMRIVMRQMISFRNISPAYSENGSQL